MQVAPPQFGEANASALAELRPESAADRLTADGRAVGLGEGEAGGDAPVRVRVGGLPPRLTGETEDSVLLYDARRLEATLGIRQIWVCRRILLPATSRCAAVTHECRLMLPLRSSRI